MTEPLPAPILGRSGLAAVILAAGSATRFGSSKQLARVGDRTMLEAVVAIARDAGLDPILAVVPSGLVVPPGVVPVRNDDPERGLSHSLQMGIAALPEEVEVAVVLLGDQPTLPVADVNAIVTARGSRPIVAASSGGLVLPPVLLERSAFDRVALLQGDSGLREIIRGNPELVREVPMDAIPADVDTPADLERLGSSGSV